MASQQNEESLRASSDEHLKFNRSLLVALVILSAQFVLGFLTSPLIARLLGPADRGRFTYFITISQWAVIIFGLGSPQALIFLIARQRFPRSQIITVALTAVLTLGGAASLIAAALLFLRPLKLTRLTSPELVLVVAFSFASFAYGMLSAVWLGLQKTTEYYLSQLLTPLLFVCVLFVLLLTGHFAYLPMIEAYTAITMIACLVIALRIVRDAGFQLMVPPRLWREMFGYGLKVYPGSLLSMLISRLDVFLLTAFHGFTALGYYAISVQMAEVVYQLSSVVATIRLPQAASKSKAEADSSFPAVSRQLILISFLSAATVAAGGIVLIRTWLPNFAPSIVALLWLLPGTISLGLAHLYFAELAGRGRPGYGSMVTILIALAMIVLDLWLIPRWGIKGAAIASSLVYASGFSLALFGVHRESGIGYRELLLVRSQDLSVYKTFVSQAKTAIQALGSRT